MTRTVQDTATIAWTNTTAGQSSAAVVDDSVSNAKLANVATATFKGRTTAGTGDPEDLTLAQARTLLAVFSGSAGATDNLGVRADGTAGGTLQAGLYVNDDSGNLYPATSDTGALGTATNMWADLFLASGAVINFNNGDITVTHSANILTFAGASSGYTFDALISPGASDGAALGSASVMWSDLFLASGAVINFNAGDVTITHSANALALAGASSGYSVDAKFFPAADDGAALGDTTHNFSDLFIASGGVINFNAGDVTVTHSANALAIAGGVTAVDAGSTVGGVKMKAVGKETIFIPASSMISRSTNGPSSGSVEQTTNKDMVKSLDFDTTTQEFAQFAVWFPKSWDLGTVTFQPSFSQLTTAAGGVVFGLAGVAVSDGDDLDVAFGTAVTSTKTAGTLNKEYQGAESAAITIAGTPAAGDRVMFQINRTVADGSDTLAQDARLHGVRLFFNTNAATDA